MNQLVPVRDQALDQLLDSDRLAERWLSGRSPRTVEAYRHDLAQFAKWYGAPNVGHALQWFLSRSMGEANELLYKYRGELVDSGLAPNTINRRITALRSIVKLARTFGMVTWTLEISGVKSKAYRDTRGPGSEGITKAKRTAAAHRNPKKAARDVAILRLFHDMALRRAEVCSLDVVHLDIHAAQLAVLGKGRRERELRTVPPVTLRALQAWIGQRGKHPGPLFVNFDPASVKAGTARLKPNGVNAILKKIGIDADVTLRPHGVRHTSITVGLELTKDPRAVQKHARHSSLETTMIYDDNIEDKGGQVAKIVSEALEE